LPGRAARWTRLTTPSILMRRPAVGCAGSDGGDFPLKAACRGGHMPQINPRRRMA
jgi:hypothetical protein